MRVRNLAPSDIPILKQWAEASGFPYPEFDDPHIEAFLVVTDSEDVPILAVIGKRMVEVYGIMSPSAGAELRNEAMAIVTPSAVDALKKLGYQTAETFLDPRLERRGFGRILTERFGFFRNWVCYGRRI